jgi:hypothetical protein
VVGGRWSLAAHWDVVAFAAVGLVFAVLVARPFEVVLGVRDAGVYANIGFAIVRTGGIVQHDELVAQIGRDQSADDPELRAAAAQAETNFLGVQHPERAIATRLRAAGFYINAGELERGRVVPQFFHLYPAWIGLLAALVGLRGGLLASGLLGFLGVWSVGMLGRRLAGRWVGLLAMLFLALNGVQVWFSRYSTSEATVQFLTFAGLYAFAVMQAEETKDAGRETKEAVGVGRSWFALRRSSFAALIAGLAFGQVALTRVDFALVVVPVVAYLFYIWLTRRWSRAHTLLAGGLLGLLLHAALHVVFIARAYFFDTLFSRLQDVSAIVATLALPFLTPPLQRIYATTTRSVLRDPKRLPIELTALIVLCVALYWLRRDGRPQRWFEQVVAHYREALLRVSVVGIVVLGVYGYLIRPQILSAQVLAQLPSCLAPAQLRQPEGVCRALQGYVGAPIAAATHRNQLVYLLTTLPDRLMGGLVPARLSDEMLLDDKPGEIGISQANLVRVGWYLSPLGMALGVAGFALWWLRGVNRAAWMFLAIGLVATVVFGRQSYGTNVQTYIYILRRFMPQVYPAFCLGIAYALVQIAAWRREQSQIAHPTAKIRLTTAVVLGLALVGFLIATDLRIYRHVEYGGALAQIESIAGRFGPRDVLLLHSGSRDEPDLVATPLRFAFGANAFTIKSSMPERYAPQIARYIRRWQEQGRTVYMAFGASGGLGLPGLRFAPAGRLALRHLDEFEQLTDQKPRNVQDFNLDFAIYRLEADDTPASAASATIGVDDYAAQLSGFYRPEQIAGTDLAWTQGDALLRLPWPRDGGPRTVALKLAAGARPASVGVGRACLEFWPEAQDRFDPPAEIRGTLGCFGLSEQMTEYTLTIDPRVYPDRSAGAMVLRIRSDTWTPAKADPAQIDRRALGVQFGGLIIEAP